MSFFLGARVAKRFGGTWFEGTVDEVDCDHEGVTLWHITYPDFDGETMTRGELATHIVYHPLLDTAGDLDVPEVDQFVWYSSNGKPRLGKVIEVDPTVSRPLTVQIYRPQSNARSIAVARFSAATEVDSGEPAVDRITLFQVQLRLKALTRQGYLSGQDRKRLQSRLLE